MQFSLFCVSSRTSTADDKLSRKKRRRKDLARPKEDEALDEEEQEDGEGWEQVKGGIKMEKVRGQMLITWYSYFFIILNYWNSLCLAQVGKKKVVNIQNTCNIVLSESFVTINMCVTSSVNMLQSWC